MRIASSTFPLLVSLILAVPALAQTEAPAPTETAPAETAPAEAGVAVTDRPTEGNEPYVAATHGAWEMRCLQAADGSDPCQLYQLVKDEKGNEVAEAVVLAVNGDENIVALVQVTAPLESLLPAGMNIAIDESPAKRVPYLWCSVRGCAVRLQLSAADLDTFKKGSKANVTMVPAAAPDKQVTASFSLEGFTAGVEALQAQE